MVIVILISLLFIIGCSNETDDENQETDQVEDQGFSEEETASDDYVDIAVGAEIKGFSEDNIENLGYEIDYPETLQPGLIFSFMAEKYVDDEPQFVATVNSFNTELTPGGQENLLTLLSLQDPITHINGCEIYEFASTSYFAYCGTEDAVQIMTVELSLDEGVDYKSSFGEILGGLVVLN